MSLNWIKITERAAEGIKIINKLDDDVFTTVINYVHKNMSPNGGEDPNDMGESLEELEQLVGIERADFLLLIKTLSYILKRASTFIMKPTKLQSELKEKLKLHDNKCDVILKLWVKNTKPILDNLELETGRSNHLENVSWKLKVQLSSEAQQKEKVALAQLQLITSNNQQINLEMNHNELTNLYNQLEAVQNEIDALRSSK